MDQNEFDEIIKKSMSNLEIAPSSELKKALAFKLFFRNLLLFHKVKLIAGVLLLGTSSVLMYQYFLSETDTTLEKQIVQETPIDTSTLENKVDVSSSDEAKNKNLVTKVNNETSLSGAEITLNEDSEAINSMNNEFANMTSDISTNYNEDMANNNNKSALSNSNSPGHINSVSIVSNNHVKTESFNGIPNDELLANNSSETSRELTEDVATFREDNTYETVQTIAPGIETEVVAKCSQPDLYTASFDEDYANALPKRGLSFDIYATPYANNKITNELDNFYEQYWWDFYKDFEYVRSGISGGINANYEYNGFKITSGINWDVIKDYRPTYEYFYDDYLVQYGGDIVSGVSVYEQDTALIFYVDKDDEKTIEEIKNNHNKYTYINVPLTIGYELNTRFASLELCGGFEWGHLAAARGLGAFNGDVDETPYPAGSGYENESVYYYRDKYFSRLNRKADMLQKNTFSYIAQAKLRAHLTNHFDIFTSVKYKQSFSGMYRDSYMLQKNYSSYGLNFGVTYHLNDRIKASSVKFN